MSSIAYVTDKQMIEFHRLNGNDGINFWRPSSGKRFTDFDSGDLLFFLAKGTERLHSREKGLIGYGRFTHSESLSYRQMWNRYGVLNGYPDEHHFKEAILRVAKSKTIPARLSCLHLKDVVFFQTPLYLSELGVKISNNVESFTYLDKDDPDMTTKILLKANDIGIDAWSSAVSASNPSYTVFDDDLNWHVIKSSHTKLPTLNTQTEKQRNAKLLKRYKESNPNVQWLDAQHQILIEFTLSGIHVISALSGNKTDMTKKAVFALGQEMVIEKTILSYPGFEDKTLHFNYVCEKELQKEIQEYPMDLIVLDTK